MKHAKALPMVVVALAAMIARADDGNTVDPPYKHASPQAVEQWRELKYGLRIHWGLYSSLGVEASWPVHKMSRAKRQEYFDLYKRFNPSEFSAEKWMDLLQRCGMTFFTITTKHHDGFSLFDTKTRVRRRFNWTAPGGPKIEDCDLAYSVMESPLKRDLIKELCDAAHKRNIAVDLYFSHIDWYDADFRFDQWNPMLDKGYTGKSDPAAYARFVRRHREQIRELLTNYGPVSMMCLDMQLPDFCWPDVKQTVLEARKLQPDLLFRNRGIGAYGDYHTPENWIPDSPDSRESKLPWMVIHTLSGQFAYDRDGSRYRSGEWVLEKLIDIVAKGGNFMVSIGPDEKGNFHPTAIKHLEYVGDWLKLNGEAIYKTRPWTAWNDGDAVRYTASKDGKHVYAVALKWPGEKIVLRKIRPAKGAKIVLLGVAEPLVWRADASGGIVIEIPQRLQTAEYRPCKQAYVFKIPVNAQP